MPLTWGRLNPSKIYYEIRHDKSVLSDRDSGRTGLCDRQKVCGKLFFFLEQSQAMTEAIRLVCSHSNEVWTSMKCWHLNTFVFFIKVKPTYIRLLLKNGKRWKQPLLDKRKECNLSFSSFGVVEIHHSQFLWVFFKNCQNVRKTLALRVWLIWKWLAPSELKLAISFSNPLHTGIGISPKISILVRPYCLH